MRGDRVGLIGSERLRARPRSCDCWSVSSSRTLAPSDEGARLQIAYFDQQREQLDPDRTVADTVNDGNDTVFINGEPRHVIGYLADFLFPRERAVSPVRLLSGGERNRLMLARLFARPANVLVMDEPTNDLDIETLELLEELVSEFDGTVLLVSHDRVFLDHIVTSTLAFEGRGVSPRTLADMRIICGSRDPSSGVQDRRPAFGPGSCRIDPRPHPAPRIPDPGSVGNSRSTRSASSSRCPRESKRSSRSRQIYKQKPPRRSSTRKRPITSARCSRGLRRSLQSWRPR